MRLNIDLLRTDGGTQPRAELQSEVVAEYAELMRSGTAFPPVSVFYDGQHYWLADGYHRFHAWRRAKPGEPIEVEVHQGTLDDARWYSYGVNKTHGLRRTNEDKERAVRTALMHPKAVSLSNGQIAEHCGVHERTVRRYREKAEAAAAISLTPVTPERSAAVPSVTATSAEPKSAAVDTAGGARGAIPARLRKCRDGRTINTAKIGRRRVPSDGTPTTMDGSPISPRARPLIRGHSSPVPMIPLQFCPTNPQTAAATLWQLFSREFVEALVQDLSRRLNQQGEQR